MEHEGRRTGFWWEFATKSDHWDKSVLGGSIILNWVLNRKEVIHWIQMDQIKHKWQVF